MKKYLSVLLIFLIFTVVFTYPSILHLENKIIGSGYDDYQMLGWQYLAKTQIDKNQNPLNWTNYWRYPVGIDFSRSFDSMLLIGIGIVLYKFIEHPVLVFNLSILFILYLSSLLSFLYFRKISQSYVLGILGGIIYSYSFYTLARLGAHSNLLLIGCYPFLLYAILKLKESQSHKNVILFFATMSMTFISSMQYFLILLSVSLFLIPVTFLVFKGSLNFTKSILKKYWLTITFCIAGLLILFCGLFLSDLLAIFTEGIQTRGLNSVTMDSAHIVNFLFPGAELPILIKTLFGLYYGVNGIEQRIFIGYIEIIVFVFFIFSKINKQLKTFLLISILITFILTLGCKNILTPYCYLYSIYPFKGIAEPTRFYIILYLLLTTTIVLFLNNITKYKMFLIVLVGCLAIFERLPSGFLLSETFEHENFIIIAKNQDSKAILDLPIVVDIWSRSQGQYDLYSVFYKKPIVNGYIHWRGNTTETRSFINYLSPLACFTKDSIDLNRAKNIFETLKSYGITTIVFHKYPEVYSQQPDETCHIAMQNINNFLYSYDLKIDVLYDDYDSSVLYLR